MAPKSRRGKTAGRRARHPMAGIARMDWTLEQRTFLHVLCSRFDYDWDTNAAIFNQVFAGEVATNGYTSGGLPVSHVRDQYKGRFKAGRPVKLWEAICDQNQTAEEMQRRRDAEDLIRQTEGRLGIRQPNEEPGALDVDEENERGGDGEEDKKSQLSELTDLVSDNDDAEEEEEEVNAAERFDLSGTEMEGVLVVTSKAAASYREQHNTPALYGKAYIDDHPNQIWHHRGGARYAAGLPGTLTGNLNKTQIRLPKATQTLASGDEYINRTNPNYNTITALHIEDVFADRNNIRIGDGTEDGELIHSPRLVDETSDHGAPRAKGKGRALDVNQTPASNHMSDDGFNDDDNDEPTTTAAGSPSPPEIGPFPGEVNDPDTVSVPPLSRTAPPRTYVPMSTLNDVSSTPTATMPPTMTNAQLAERDGLSEQERLHRQAQMFRDTHHLHAGLRASAQRMEENPVTWRSLFGELEDFLADVSSDEEEE